MSTNINQDQLQNDKRISYLLPVNMEFYSEAQRSVIGGYKDTVPLSLSEHELAQIEKQAKDNHMSFDHALLAFYERSINIDERAKLIVLELRQKHSEFGNITVRLKLTGKILQGRLEPRNQLKTIEPRKGVYLGRRRLSQWQWIGLISL